MVLNGHDEYSYHCTKKKPPVLPAVFLLLSLNNPLKMVGIMITSILFYSDCYRVFLLEPVVLQVAVVQVS